MQTIPYGRQSITEEDIQSVIEVLRSDFLTQGPKVKEFENAFSNYVGSKYAVAVSNGTTALHLSALALGVGPKKKVITSPITFVASANCVLYCGGDVVFADIDPKNYCLDLNKVEDLLKKNPNEYSGIIPVDFAGYPIDMSSYNFLAKKYGLWIIEDACHAPGAIYKDQEGLTRKSGDGHYADLAVFSFHPVKHIACGEGGMITTNDQALYQKLLLLRTHGITKDPSLLSKVDGGWYYEMQELGFNYRLPDILCALGVSQLTRAASAFERRQQIAKRYLTELSGLPLTLPFHKNSDVHAYHLFIIQTEKRKELYQYLLERKIACQVHYIPVHQQPFYKAKYGEQQFEVADQFYDKCLSLPIYQSMSDEEQQRVIEGVKSFYGR